MLWLRELFTVASYVLNEVQNRKNGQKVQSSWLYISRLFQKYLFVQSGDAKCEMCHDRSFALEYCRNCDYFIDQYCADCHDKIINFQGHDRRRVSCDMKMHDLAPEQFCKDPDHTNCTVNSFCSCCQELICNKCHKNHKRDGHVIVLMDEFLNLIDNLIRIKPIIEKNLSILRHSPELGDEFDVLSAAAGAIDTVTKSQRELKISDIPMKIRLLCGIESLERFEKNSKVPCKEKIEHLTRINERLKEMLDKRSLKTEIRYHYQESFAEGKDTTHVMDVDNLGAYSRQIEEYGMGNRLLSIANFETTQINCHFTNECGSFSSGDLFDNNPNGLYHQKTPEEEIKGLQSDRELEPFHLESFKNLHPN